MFSNYYIRTQIYKLTNKRQIVKLSDTQYNSFAKDKQIKINLLNVSKKIVVTQGRN